jgi:uncharacterized protein (UPF0276 family)
MTDRVGLGWRPELAAGIFANMERIGVIEVIADDYFDSRLRARAIETLARQRPVVLHGVSLGLASDAPVERKRLDKMARLVERVKPESWSEHLAFVRAGGVEIGHLAAAPRTRSTIDAAAANVDRARRAVGLTPHVENIATLIDPPASDFDEPEWLKRTIEASGASLLLDLHNLYANAVNFGSRPEDFLARLPLERVEQVHISGGKWIDDGNAEHRRILDDHLHDPPDPVYDLLEALAERCPNPLTVILERDGSYPPMAHLMSQLERARRAMARGRLQQAAA